MRAGVIDIGSSSIKLLIGESDGQKLVVLEQLKNLLPIGKSAFFKGSISPEIAVQTINILEKYAHTLREYEVSDITLIATTAVREARNRDIFIDTILRKTGFAVEILTAGDVIYYIDSYLSDKLKKSYPVHEKTLLIAELGSGSMDVSLMDKGFTQLSLGLPVGTLRIKQLMNKFEATQMESIEALKEYVEHEFVYLKSNFPRSTVDDIMLIDEKYSVYLHDILGGAKSSENFFTLTPADTEKLLECVQDKSVNEISSAYGIPEDIADTIIAYAVVLNTFFTLAPLSRMYILQTSLAEAILANTLLGIELAKKYNKTNQLISAATFLCRKYSVDLNHARQVAELSRSLFEGLKAQMGLRPDDILYVLLAAYLHDIGSFIHNRSHHKHSEYIISCLNLFRLTEEEIIMIACIARYHRKALPMNVHVAYNSLNQCTQILVQKLSALLRIANALDCSHRQKIKKIDVMCPSDVSIVIEAVCSGNMLLEKLEFRDKKVFFEEITGSKITLIQKGRHDSQPAKK